MQETHTSLPAHAISAGTVLDKSYAVLRLLDSGGMGDVYLVSDQKLNSEQIALKVLLRGLASRPQQSQRLLREVQLTRKVTNDHVVRTHDVESVPQWIDQTVMHLLGKKPNERPVSCEKLLAVLHKGAAQNAAGMELFAAPNSLDSPAIIKTYAPAIIEAEPVIYHSKSLEDAPAELDAASAQHSAQAKDRLKIPRSPLFGRKFEHINAATVTRLTLRGFALSLCAIAIVIGLNLSVGEILRQGLLVISSNQSIFSFMGLVFGCVVYGSILVAMPVMVITGLVNSIRVLALRTLRMIALSALLFLAALTFHYIRMELAGQAFAPHFDRSKVLVALYSAMSNSFAAAMLIPQGTVYSASTHTLSAIRASQSWSAYTPFILHFICYVTLVVACVKDIALKRGRIPDPLLLKLAGVTSLICITTGVLTRVLLQIVAAKGTQASEILTAINVQVGPLALVLDKLTLGVSLVNWSILLAALTIVTIRRRNLGIE